MSEPPLRRKRLGAALRELRVAADADTHEGAKRVGISQARLSRMETAQGKISGDDAWAICTAFGADEATTEALVQLARQSNRRDWWHVYGDLLGSVRGVFELETDATLLQTFSIDIVPALVQTDGYAEALISLGFPTEDRHAIRQRVELRMARKRRLDDRSFEYWVIVDEAALVRPVGGHEVMVEQIECLIEAASTPRVSVQIVPMSTPGHVALGMPFSVFTLGDSSRYAYVDAIGAGLYVEDKTQVGEYLTLWSRLSAMALSYEETQECLSRIAADHRSAASDRPKPLRVAKEQP